MGRGVFVSPTLSVSFRRFRSLLSTAIRCLYLNVPVGQNTPALVWTTKFHHSDARIRPKSARNFSSYVQNFALMYSHTIELSKSRDLGLGCVMTWDVSFTCDICGKKKGEANHWWMVLLGDVPCYDEGQPGQRFTLLPWNSAESRNNDMYHLCGQGCAMKAMVRFMTTGAIDTLEDDEVSEPAYR